MKILVKYVIGTVVFGVIYMLLEYLFSKDIDWKMVIISMAIYFALNIVFHFLEINSAKKK